jgi:lysophospholipase L1-like esterase
MGNISVSVNGRSAATYDPPVSRLSAPSRALVATVLWSLLGTLSPTLVAPAAHAAGPVRLLLTGDSITNGRQGDYTWRYRLYKEFQRQGVAVDLVGSRTSPYVEPGYRSASYADPRFDQNHFAHFGWELSSMVRAIGPEVAKQQPDVVVLEAGINDLRNHTADPAIVDKTATALRQWIANVRSAKSDVRILLSPVLTVDTARAALLNPLVARFNARETAVAAELTTPDSPITVATTNQGWNPRGGMSYDGLHPTPTGETLIGQRLGEALRRVGILRTAPRIYAVVPWRQTQRARLGVVGKRTTLSWSRQAISGVRVQVRRPGARWVALPGLIRTGRLVVRTPRKGVYQFKLRLQRGRMLGPWGPVVQARVKARH